MFSSLNQNGTGGNSYRHHKIKTSAKIRTTIHTGVYLIRFTFGFMALFECLPAFARFHACACILFS
jgi:hypothetical protein